MYRSSLARDNNTSGTGALGGWKVSLPPPRVTDVDIDGRGELLVGFASGFAFWDMVVIGTVGEIFDSKAVVSSERLEAPDGRIVELMIALGKELWENVFERVLVNKINSANHVKRKIKYLSGF